MGQRYLNAPPPHIDKLDFWFDPCNPKSISYKSFDTSTFVTNSNGSVATDEFEYDAGPLKYPGYIISLDETHGETPWASNLKINSPGLKDLSGNNHHMIQTSEERHVRGRTNDASVEDINVLKSSHAQISNSGGYVGGTNAEIDEHYMLPPFVAPADSEKVYFAVRPYDETTNAAVREDELSGWHINTKIYNSLFFDSGNYCGDVDHDNEYIVDNASTGATGANGMAAISRNLPIFSDLGRLKYEPKGSGEGAILPLISAVAKTGDDAYLRTSFVAKHERFLDNSSDNAKAAFYNDLKMSWTDEYGLDSSLNRSDYGGYNGFLSGPNNWMMQSPGFSLASGYVDIKSGGGDLGNSLQDLSYDAENALWRAPHTGQIINFSDQSHHWSLYEYFDNGVADDGVTINPNDTVEDMELGPVVSTALSSQKFDTAFSFFPLRSLKPTLYSDTLPKSLFSLGEGKNPDLPLQPVGNPDAVLVLTNGSMEMKEAWQDDWDQEFPGVPPVFSKAAYSAPIGYVPANGYHYGLSERVPQGKFGVVKPWQKFDAESGQDDPHRQNFDPFGNEIENETLLLNPTDFSFAAPAIYGQAGNGKDNTSGYYIFVYSSKGVLARIYTRGLTGRGHRNAQMNASTTGDNNHPRDNLYGNSTIPTGHGGHSHNTDGELNCIYANINFEYFDLVDTTEQFTFLIYKEHEFVYPPVKQKAHTFPGRVLLSGNTFSLAANCHVGPNRTYDKLTFACWFRELDRSHRTPGRDNTASEPENVRVFKDQKIDGLIYSSDLGDRHTPINSSFSDADAEKHVILASKYFNVGIFGTGQMYVQMRLQDSGTFPASNTDFGTDAQSGDHDNFKQILISKGPKVGRGVWEWKHLAVTLDTTLNNPQLIFYVDGEVVHTQTSGNTITGGPGYDEDLVQTQGNLQGRSDNSRWFIGAPVNDMDTFDVVPNSSPERPIFDHKTNEVGPGLRAIPGSLGCIKLWRNQALTSSEVQSLYNSQKARYVPEVQNYAGLNLSFNDDNTITLGGTGSEPEFLFTSGPTSLYVINGGTGQTVYTATTNQSNVSFSLANRYNHAKFSIDSNTGVLTLLENPPAVTNPTIGLYTVDIVASKTGFDDITKTVTVTNNAFISLPGPGATLVGPGQENTGGQAVSSYSPYTALVNELNAQNAQSAFSNNDATTISRIVQTIQNTSLLNHQSVAINPRVFAVVGDNDKAEGLSSTSTGANNLEAPGFWKTYFDNSISLNSLLNSADFDDGSDSPYLGYVAYDNDYNLLGIIFVYFPAGLENNDISSARRAVQPSTLSSLFNLWAGQSASSNGVDVTAIGEKRFGIRTIVYNARDGSVQTPQIYKETDELSNSWAYSTRNLSSSTTASGPGYNNNTAFSLDDGVWGVGLNQHVFANVTNTTKNSWDKDKQYVVANWNGNDRSDNSIWGSESTTRLESADIKFFCFV